MRVLAVVALALVTAACSAGPPAPPEATPSETLTIVAQGTAFDQTQLSVTADTPFAVTLDNRDSVPHNFAIRNVGSGEVFSGPQQRTTVFRALAAGSYAFLCEVHPEMAGTLEAVAAS